MFWRQEFDFDFPGLENVIFDDFCTKNVFFWPRLGAPTRDLDLAGLGRQQSQLANVNQIQPTSNQQNITKTKTGPHPPRPTPPTPFLLFVMFCWLLLGWIWLALENWLCCYKNPNSKLTQQCKLRKSTKNEKSRISAY